VARLTVWWRRRPVADVVALTALALALRIGGFDGHRLFLDDAAVAVVRRAGSLRDVLRVGVTAPGFALAERGVIAVAGYGVAALKVVPVVAGVAGPAAVWGAARRLGFARGAALGAGALVATSPVHVAMSGHVKQYTLEVVLTCVLLSLGWSLVTAERPRPTVAVTFAVAALLSTFFSAATASIVIGVYAGAAVACVRRRHVDYWLVVTAVGWVAVFGTWTLAVLSHHTNALLRHHWHGYFVPTDEGALETVRVAAVRVVAAFAGLTRAYPVAFPAAVLGAALLARRRLEAAVALVTPIAVALALSIAERAPFGGGESEGRIDSALYPVLALLVVAGLAYGVRSVPLLARALAVGVAAVALVRLPVHVRYPDQDPAHVVATLAARVAPDDAVFVHPLASFHVATDGPWDVDIRPAAGSTTNFWPWITAARPAFHMPSVCCDDPADLVPAADAAAGAPRIWLVALFSDRDSVLPLLERRGYTLTRRWTSPGATLDLLTRR
jgi:hypothetical protein